MNILFLTIGRMDDIEAHSIYPDLLREFRDKGNNVYIVAAQEKRTGVNTKLVNSGDAHILHVRIGNITKCNMIEKGLSTVRIERQYKSAIKHYFSDVKFDLVMYSTPPITLVGVVDFIKKRDGAKSYLLLKDIFPQNAVDIGLMSEQGPKGLIYKYFRSKEKKLYEVSDHIGCMSQANVDFVLKHNPEINKEKADVCPNCIEPRDMSVNTENKIAMRRKYDIPEDKTVFVYGGNLGRPQGIPFLIKCLESQKENEKTFFLIVGDGTEYGRLEEFIESSKQKNVKLMSRLPKEDYDSMVGSCDAGLIFLDHRFTIPNFPSRLLAYMQAKIPVIAATDPNTDIGKVIVNGGIGWWCESNDANAFSKIIEKACKSNRTGMGNKGYQYMLDNYTTEKGYQTIISSVRG